MHRLIFKYIVATTLIFYGMGFSSLMATETPPLETAMEETIEPTPLHLTVLNVMFYQDWRQVKGLIEVLPHVVKMVPEKESAEVGEYRIEITQPPEDFFKAVERNFGLHYDMELSQPPQGVPALTMRKKSKK